MGVYDEELSGFDIESKRYLMNLIIMPFVGAGVCFQFHQMEDGTYKMFWNIDRICGGKEGTRNLCAYLKAHPETRAVDFEEVLKSKEFIAYAKGLSPVQGEDLSGTEVNIVNDVLLADWEREEGIHGGMDGNWITLYLPQKNKHYKTHHYVPEEWKELAPLVNMAVDKADLELGKHYKTSVYWSQARAELHESVGRNWREQHTVLDLQTIKAVIYGHAIGDALGVPVEFETRETLEENPVTDMRGYGTHDVPAGTWSDDTSMTLALLESLARLGRVDYDDIMKNFVRWVNEAAFTATGELFDIGRGTRQALVKYWKGTAPLECGGQSDGDNGNGSLMRIAPLALYLYAKHGTALDETDMEIVHNVSALTHGHPRSKMACGIYTMAAVRLLDGQEAEKAIRGALREAKAYYEPKEEYAPEMETYSRLWKPTFRLLHESVIRSNGYVVDTLEAALWCLLNTFDYRSCVLRAVNLGEDTDTVAAVAGGLAGMAYGMDATPSQWIDALQNKKELERLCEIFYESIRGSGKNET